MKLTNKQISIVIDEIYKQADDLLYEAKRNGRNQIKMNT